MTNHPAPQPPAPEQPGTEWQPTNPPAPQPPAQQKSWFARHKILTGILALLLLIVVAQALGGDDDATEAAPAAATGQAAADTDANTATDTDTAAAEPAADEPSAEEPAAEEPVEEPAETQPGIGDAVRDGKFEFVVTGVEDGGTEVGSEFLSEKAQGRFHLVHLTVTNIGDKPQMMFDSNQKVRDEQGRTFETNSSAAILMDDNDMWLKDINPGNTMSGTLVFDMPEGATPVEIELHDSMFSGGVTVALK